MKILKTYKLELLIKKIALLKLSIWKYNRLFKSTLLMQNNKINPARILFYHQIFNQQSQYLLNTNKSINLKKL